MNSICGDNRFELIEKYKQRLIESTNIESSKEEMAVIDNILYRFWQMGWLDKLEMFEQINEFIMQKWIPVSERLPEEEKIVIVSTEYGLYPEARYTKEGWKWAYESGADYWENLENVLAWMPLPKPYKAESESE